MKSEMGIGALLSRGGCCWSGKSKDAPASRQLHWGMDHRILNDLSDNTDSIGCHAACELQSYEATIKSIPPSRS